MPLIVILYFERFYFYTLLQREGTNSNYLLLNINNKLSDGQLILSKYIHV